MTGPFPMFHRRQWNSALPGFPRKRIPCRGPGVRGTILSMAVPETTVRGGVGVAITNGMSSASIAPSVAAMFCRESPTSRFVWRARAT